MSKKNTGVEMLGFAIKRPICSFDGCNNKAKRIGKRKYSDRCHLHTRYYYAQNVNQENEK